jgi:uncharacterized membrane protein YkoI
MKKMVIQIGLALASVAILTGCANQSKTDSKSENTTSKTSQQSTSNQHLKNITEVSVKDAIKAYHDRFDDAEITSIELEKSLGRPIYTIEGVDDHQEHQLSINAKNKRVFDVKTDDLEQDEKNGKERQNNQLDTNKLLDIKKIAQIAEDKIGKGNATKFNLEEEQGITYWKVKVENKGQEHVVKVNAQKGNVLEVEQDD